MGSINSLGGSVGLTNSILSRRIDEPDTPEADERFTDQRLRSTEKDDRQPASLVTLSAEGVHGGASGTPQTYTHIETSLTSDQLDLADIRGSLGQLQDLVGDATSFKGSLRAESAPGQIGNLPNTDGGADSGNLFSLVITTADGDRVELNISKSHGTEGDFSAGGYSYQDTTISFKIDGELDAGEWDALTALTDKLGGLGDSYRSDGWLQVGDLNAFDHGEFTGFSLSVQGLEESNFSLDYQVDTDSGERSLVSDLNGYEFNITVDIDGLKLDKNIKDNHQYEQYRQLIRDTAYSYKQGEEAGGVSSSKASLFFLQGMDAIFQADFRDESDERAVNTDDSDETKLDGELAGMNASNQQLLDNFSSGLPDFKASFDTPVFRPNEDQPSEVSTMSLDISQVTEITQSRNNDHSYTEINQRSEYQSRVSQHLGLGGGDVKHANLESEEDGGQSYLYRTDLKSASIDRSLNFQDSSKLLSIDELRQQQHIQKDKTVIGGKIDSDVEKDLSSPLKNTATHIDVDSALLEQKRAQKSLGDYRAIELIETISDGDKVELFQ